LRLREEFLSIASHELKTPLTALQLQTQMLRRFLQRGQPGVSQEMGTRVFDSVDRQVKRLSRLTNDLLDVSRIASGRFQLECEEVDLGQLVLDVTDRFAEELEAVGCTLTLDLQHDVVGRWDRHRLDQVIANIIGNALKYGRGRPVTISVRREQTTAIFEVADEGVGIAEDDLVRIFDRFERVETTERAGGLGLGLYIAREIVEAHGGRIRVESRQQLGSRFTAEFPM
jgi:signal transduction histidine kinase